MDIAQATHAGAPEIGVIHMIHPRNELASFKHFPASYRKYPAGMLHELILILKLAVYFRHDSHNLYQAALTHTKVG